MVSIHEVKFIIYLIWGGVTVILIRGLLLCLSTILGARSYSQELRSPYECGFDPKGRGHLDFSVRFFTIAAVFLVFDAEVALIMPLVVIKVSTVFVIWAFTRVAFILALILGLLYEWSEGALEWK